MPDTPKNQRCRYCHDTGRIKWVEGSVHGPLRIVWKRCNHPRRQSYPKAPTESPE